MDRLKKLELVQRSLGLRHKLKVHETMKAPETHEELSLMLLAKWELEDELRAIEELLGEDRQANVARRRRDYEAEIREAVEADEPDGGKKRKAKK